VAYGDGVGEFGKDVGAGAKDPADGAHTGIDLNRNAIAGGDAGGFLAAVLQGEQAVVGLLHSVRVAVNPEQTAVFLFIARR